MKRDAFDRLFDLSRRLAITQQAGTECVGDRTRVLVADGDGSFQIAPDQGRTNRAENLGRIDLHAVEDYGPLDDDDEAHNGAEQHRMHRYAALNVIIYQCAPD